MKENGPQIMGEKRRALTIGHHPPPIEYRYFIKRESKSPGCSGACTMATVKCTFLEGRELDLPTCTECSS